MKTTTGHLIQKFDSPSGQVSYILLQLEEHLPFEEGQFVMIQTTIQGKTIKKPYSIASTNKDMKESKQVGFVIKKVSEAGMSHYLTQNIHIGDMLTVTGPVGHYTDSQTHKNYLFIATGSGLPPNVGLFKHLAYETQNYQKIVQIFGEKTEADMVPEIIEMFTQHNQKNITHFFHLSREESSFFVNQNTGVKMLPGYVQSSLPKAIEILGTETSCFICGLPAMVDEVRSMLQDLGIDKEDITFEKY